MKKETGCHFNCRERALLPWLLLGGLLIAVCLGARGKAGAAAQQQPAAAGAKPAPVASAPQPAPPAVPDPVFDVASIHLHIPEPHEHNSIWSSPFDGSFKAENLSIVELIHWAYEMPETRILGAAAWANSTYFDIDAKADPSIDQQLHSLTSDAGRKQKEEMVQALLADRFRLVAHLETRELPIYVLVVAKGGPKLGAVRETGSWVNTGNGRIEVQMQNSVAAACRGTFPGRGPRSGGQDRHDWPLSSDAPMDPGRCRSAFARKWRRGRRPTFPLYSARRATGPQTGARQGTGRGSSDRPRGNAVGELVFPDPRPYSLLPIPCFSQVAPRPSDKPLESPPFWV